MTVARNAADALAGHVTLEVESIDRLYLNVYQPTLQTPGGAFRFFREVRGCPVPSSALMAPMTRSFVAAIEAFVAERGLDLVTFERGERKDDRTQEYLRAWPGGEGVLYVGKAQEKARVLRTQASTDPASGRRTASLIASTAMPNAYYFYAFDDDFGPFFLKFCSYFPYNAKLCANGHEYVKRQLQKRGIAFTALDNGILECAQAEVLPELCAEVTAERLDALLRKWLAQLPHPFTAADRAMGMCYQVSVLQAEFSLTQVFDRPQQGRVFFEEVLRENLDAGRPDRVQLVFERRVSKRTPGRFRTRVLTAGVDPSLHFEYKKTRVKQYFKEGRALRTETTINDTYDFGIGRKLGNLEDLKTIGFAANRRLLCAERLSHDCGVGASRLAELHAPGAAEGQRTPALRFGDARVQAVLAAVLAFAFQPHGFRQRQLRERVAALLGKPLEEWSSGRMTYDLRRLRLRGLIERIAGTRRYRLTADGLRTALVFHRTYARVLRPSLAAALAPEAAPTAPLNKVLERFDGELQRLWEGQSVAA